MPTHYQDDWNKKYGEITPKKRRNSIIGSQKAARQKKRPVVPNVYAAGKYWGVPGFPRGASFEEALAVNRGQHPYPATQGPSETARYPARQPRRAPPQTPAPSSHQMMRDNQLREYQLMLQQRKEAELDRRRGMSDSRVRGQPYPADALGGYPSRPNETMRPPLPRSEFWPNERGLWNW